MPFSSKSKRRIVRTLRAITIFSVLSSVLFGVYFIFVKSEFFNVKNISIDGGGSYVNIKDVSELLDARVLGGNIVLLDADKLESLLLENFQGAHDIKVVKKFPNTLAVIIDERAPVAVIRSRDTNMYLIDKSGYVLGIIEEGTSNLPIVYYQGNVAVGYFLDDEMISAYFEIIEALDKEKINVGSMNLHSDYVSFDVEGGVEALVGKAGSKTKMIGVLSALLKQLAVESKDAKRIDLRYDKVIVSYR